MKFSVVIPSYNSATTLSRCLSSLLAQTINRADFETIVVDDFSTDGSSTIARAWMAKLYPLTVLKTNSNAGPGAARNLGLATAEGEWVVFLDADDELAQDALAKLMLFISLCDDDLDLVRLGRNDIESEAKWLNGPHDELLRHYVSLRMDGSACGTAVHRETLGHLQFRPGYHEDVDWLYLAYSLARRTACLDEPLYVKHGSGITGTVTERHIDGFIAAWKAVANYYNHRLTLKETKRGVIGVVATRVREIYRRVPDKARQVTLLRHLGTSLPQEWKELCTGTKMETQYAKIARQFCTSDTSSVDTSLFNNTWSCKDLQYSAYLGPDEVRACCKRFFVNGERRGDVVLLKTKTMTTSKVFVGAQRIDATASFTPAVTPTAIRDAKLSLLDAINAGEETSCTGCPWLEFKEHEPIGAVVSYLSMEQHSVCNLQCSYCDSKYWDGRRPTYDAAVLAKELIVKGGTVVWGGGEPTVSPEFKALVLEFAEQGMQQRVLSNCVKYSAELEEALTYHTVELVTSVDAGTPETYKKVRGTDKFDAVLENLSRYAETAADRVTVKYILTEDNYSDIELRMFVDSMKRYESLLRCNFQISCDFRNEKVTVLELRAMVFLHNLLIDAGAECVFLDDLCRIRIVPLLENAVAMLGCVHRPTAQTPVISTYMGLPVASSTSYPEVIVWGTGEQADRLLRSSVLFRTAKCVRNVDSDTFDGTLDTFPNQYALPANKRDLPIVIAASQSYPRIFHEIKERGLQRRLVKELIL